LAGLVLERDIIRRVLRKDIMKESVIFQEIDAAGFDRGVQTGIQTGIQQGEQALILRLLQRRVGSLTSEARSHIEALPREQLESLGEALLDFSSAGDLENWLQDKT
jgi:predicted transposase YdaD